MTGRVYQSGPNIIADSTGNYINPATSDNQTNGNQICQSRLYDASGNSISSFRGAVDIHDSCTHRQGTSSYAWQDGGDYTLTADAAAGDTSITVTDATGLVVGDRLSPFLSGMNCDNNEWRITAIVGNVLTLNRPIDNSYTAVGTTIKKTLVDMNVSGSLASPQSFKVIGKPGEVWHVTSMNVIITDATAMDDGLFGGLTSLTNGVVVRYYDGTDYCTNYTWSDNGSLFRDGFSAVYTSKAPSGQYGFDAQYPAKDRDGFIWLVDYDNNKYIEVLIQDDLTGLLDMRVKVQSHIEGL